MRRVDSLFAEYSQSHGHPVNKLIHNIAVPLIYFATFGLLYAIPVPSLFEQFAITFAHIALVAALFYYFTLSGPIGAGMTLMTMIIFWLISVVEQHQWGVWQVSLVVFVVMWILQFVGHHLEGKRPSFTKDLQFLLVGPAWVLSGWLKKFNIAY